MAAVTLGVFLQEETGKGVVVELKDETAIEGKIVCVDPQTLNIELTNVIVYRRRIRNLKPSNLSSIFIKVEHRWGVTDKLGGFNSGQIYPLYTF
jgi:small nuclear ribonucleoprotein (snRNP)-like protein